ncbi:MAG: PstS family phosphate ABC transporter substrate-binding protein [Desulfobulbaceae bacterium]|nr:PstS family phosphate ABC transporter substrate-binding protein [Desulfobulbaceae bacterium]
MKFRGLLLGVLATALLAGLTGCGNNTGDKQQPAAGGQTRYLTIKGSDTMVHLVSEWAEAFMQKLPAADLSVTGGGSGTGIAALINNTTDICAASRSINEKEITLAAAKKIQPSEFKVAMDGIALVVNPANPISQLTVEQVKKIFTGTVNNWKQVGGPDQPILVLSRESSSGTFVFFQEHVLDKQDYSRNARSLPGTSAMIQNIATDTWTIGYVGLGYAQQAADKVKTLAIAANADQPAITPSVATINSGEYVIARPLFLYTAGEPTGLTKEFLDYALSGPGQEIVRQAGYVPLQ